MPWFMIPDISPGLGKGIRYDRGFHDVRLSTEPAICLRNGPRDVTMLDQQAVPRQHLLIGLATTTAYARRLVAVRLDKFFELILERQMLGGVAEIHHPIPHDDAAREPPD